MNRNISVGRVRETLAILEQALGQSDLVPVFEGAIAQARRLRRD